MGDSWEIEAKALVKTYKSGEKVIRAVDNISLDIKRGEFVSIVGHSGSGKTTLLNLIGGLTRPNSGTVIINGIDLWSMDDNDLSEFRNRKLSFIFQFFSLIPTLNATENVLFPMTFRDSKDDFCPDAIKLLDMVGLIDKVDAYPSQLSGGEQRRVAIARAFINNPEIILADEPTGDLDEETETEMMSLFKKMNKDKGITFIMVTHNLELAGQAERQLRMSNGRLIAL